MPDELKMISEKSTYPGDLVSFLPGEDYLVPKKLA
jgi:hypothetical protein